MKDKPDIVKCKYVDIYRDGGTLEYVTEAGTKYYIDHRIKSPTKGKVFNEYPGHKGAKVLNVEIVVVNDWGKKG